MVNLWLILFFTVLVFSFGCSSKDPNPELRDPIYKAIQGEISRYKAEVDNSKKTIEDLEKQLKKAPARSRERKVLIRDIQKARRRLLAGSQKREYLEIRLVRRRAEDRINYEISRKLGEDWPNKQEEEQFKINQRLKNPEIRQKDQKRVPASKK